MRWINKLLDTGINSSLVVTIEVTIIVIIIICKVRLEKQGLITKVNILGLKNGMTVTMVKIEMPLSHPLIISAYRHHLNHYRLIYQVFNQCETINSNQWKKYVCKQTQKSLPKSTHNLTTLNIFTFLNCVSSTFFSLSFFCFFCPVFFSLVFVFQFR